MRPQPAPSNGISTCCTGQQPAQRLAPAPLGEPPSRQAPCRTDLLSAARLCRQLPATHPPGSCRGSTFNPPLQLTRRLRSDGQPHPGQRGAFHAWQSNMLKGILGRNPSFVRDLEVKTDHILIKFTSDKHTELPAVAELGARPRLAGTVHWPVSPWPLTRRDLHHPHLCGGARLTPAPDLSFSPPCC